MQYSIWIRGGIRDSFRRRIIGKGGEEGTPEGVEEFQEHFRAENQESDQIDAQKLQFRCKIDLPYRLQFCFPMTPFGFGSWDFRTIRGEIRALPLAF